MTFDFLMPFDDVERSPSHTSIPTTRTAPMETLYHTINLFIKFIVKHKKKKRFFGGYTKQITKNIKDLIGILTIVIQTINTNNNVFDQWNVST